MAWDKTPWAPPLVELAGGMAGHLLAWERHERETGCVDRFTGFANLTELCYAAALDADIHSATG